MYNSNSNSSNTDRVYSVIACRARMRQHAMPCHATPHTQHNNDDNNNNNLIIMIRIRNVCDIIIIIMMYIYIYILYTHRDSHTTYNTQQTAHSTQHTTHNTQQTTLNTQHTTHHDTRKPAHMDAWRHACVYDNKINRNTKYNNNNDNRNNNGFKESNNNARKHGGMEA